MNSTMKKVGLLAALLSTCLPAYALPPTVQPPSIPAALIGQPNGVPQLDGSGRVPVTQAPTKVSRRNPTRSDDQTLGYVAGDFWLNQATNTMWQAVTVAPGVASWSTYPIGNYLPLDTIGVSATGAYGSVLMTRNANVVALNKAVDIWRGSDGTVKTFGWVNGEVDAAGIDAFVLGSWGEISKAYDQSFNVATGALNGNDAAQTPGFIVPVINPSGGASATVVTGGTCTDGTYTFTVAGGTGTPSTISGTVTGGVLAGTLSVVTTGSYYGGPTGVPTGNPTLTGGTCTVQPTAHLVFTHNAPQWTQATVNGHRTITFSDNYAPLSSQVYNPDSEQLVIPTSASFNRLGVTMLAALQMRTAISGSVSLAAIGPASDGWYFSPVASNGNPGLSLPPNVSTALAARTSPSVMWARTGATSTIFGVNNKSTTITYNQPSSAKTGATIGGDGGNGHRGNFELLGMILAQNLTDAQLAAGRAAMTRQNGIVPQAPDILAMIGDSITYSLDSQFGNSWTKYLQARGLLSRDVQVVNLGYPGGQFLNGTYNYTANFAADWIGTYSASAPNIICIITLGTNDIGTGATGATTYARAKAYATLVLAQGPNVRLLVATLLPRNDQVLPELAVYNSLLRANATKPISKGGLGATALIDLAADPVWSGSNYGTYLFGGSVSGLHPTDQGSEDIAVTASSSINAILP